ncbi:MAG: hypothetical protein F6J97_06045 [Leptolyngbya sp. SIO4C1]|nr:hypothetical protein [Leptolyngbya sp. SIO4C1]
MTNFMNPQKIIWGMAAMTAAALAPVPALAATMYTADLDTLNADFGSTASGFATLTLDQPSEFIRTIRVQMTVTGLEDTTSFGGVHVAHIHGQFAGNATRPLFDQGNGPFFEGTGGTPVDSVVPTLANDDVDGDGYLNFIEGRPAYGPVVLNLSSEQQPAPPAGVPPLTQFLTRVGAGEINPAELFPSGTELNLDTTYTFDLSDPDQARQFNNIGPLEKREIVAHGLTVPAAISDPIDAVVAANGGGAPTGVPLGDGRVFRITAPVAAGTIRLVEDNNGESVPEPVSMSLLSASVLAAALGITRRRQTA